MLLSIPPQYLLYHLKHWRPTPGQQIRVAALVFVLGLSGAYVEVDNALAQVPHKPGIGYTLHTGGQHDLRDFNQTDRRWANKYFGGLTNFKTMAAAGCCPSSLAMVDATLTGDRQVRPTTYAWKYKRQVVCGSPPHALWREGCVKKVTKRGKVIRYGDQLAAAGRDMGLKVRRVSGYGLETARRAIKRGGLAIFQFGPGPFTGFGHCAVAYRADGSGTWFADPYNSGVKQNVQKRGWTASQLASANVIAIWIYYRPS